MWKCVALWALLATQDLWAEPHLKSIKVAITNPTGENRPAENIVLPVPELKKIAPDFYPGSQIVTASNASTIAEAIVQHLTGILRSNVSITLEIDATLPEGVPDNVVRTVTENCRTLKFESGSGFEET